MNSAIALTLSLFMTLTIGMPLVGWLISRQHGDRLVRIWFLAIVFDSLQIPVVAAQGSYPGWVTYVIPSAISVLFYATLWQVLRSEREPVLHFWGKILVAGAFYTVLGTIAYELAGHAHLEIYTFNNLVYLLLALLVAIEALRVGLQNRSLSLYFVSAGFVIGAIGYAVRAYWHLVLNVGIPVFEFSAASNFLVITQALNLVLMTFGYLGFVRDKAEIAKTAFAAEAAAAIAKEEAAEHHAKELQKTVGERDHMVMVNSRFLNLGALATFNSAIVHEISQPLQAVGMCLEGIRARDQQQGGVLAAEIKESIALNNKVGDIINALRQMMQLGNGLSEKTDVIAALREILPIIEGDARHRKVKVLCDLPQDQIFCDCNGVLFQRLMINLVANAFDAFMAAGTANPVLAIEVAYQAIEGNPGVAIKVADNGPGMSDEAMRTLFQPFNTQKPTGLGIGLSLADILLRKWRGRINVDKAVMGSGTVFAVVLPILTDA